MTALASSKPLFSRFAADQDASAYADERRGVITLHQLVDKPFGDTDHFSEFSKR
jgi:hypothetical protein